MKKSELITWLERVQGDPEVLIEDRSTDGVAREAQLIEQVWAVPDFGLRTEQRIFWEENDPERPARHPGDSPDDPEPVIALVLR